MHGSTAIASPDTRERQPESPAQIPRRMAYKVPEAAALLNLHPRTVWRLVKSGALPSVKLGGSRRIRHEDLEAYLRGQDGAQ